MFKFQSPFQRFELDRSCSICLTFPKEQVKMKCCGSFLCQTCYDYALLRYGQCSFCSKSEYNLKNGSPNDTSVKMEICNDCDEEVAEKEFEAHKMCTKALVSEYVDKLAQQRIELEKSHNLKMLKLELKNKLALRKMATKARKLNEENGELRKKIEEASAEITTHAHKILDNRKSHLEKEIENCRVMRNDLEELKSMTMSYFSEMATKAKKLDDENDELRKKSAAEEATIKTLKAENNLAEDKIKNMHALITTHEDAVLDIIGYVCLGGNRIFDPNQLLTGLQHSISETVQFLQTKTDNQRYEINKLHAKLGHFGGPRYHYG